MNDISLCSRTGRAALIAVCIGACIAATPAVRAESRHVERDAEGRRGGSVHAERDRSPGHAQREVYREGAGGRSMSDSRTRDYDAQTGVYSGEHTRSYTGRNGQTATDSREVTRDGTGATVTREATWTGAQGQTVTGTRDVERSEDTVIVERTLTGPDGQTYGSTRIYERPAGD